MLSKKEIISIKYYKFTLSVNYSAEEMKYTLNKDCFSYLGPAFLLWTKRWLLSLSKSMLYFTYIIRLM